jgi:hypothetical protein
LKDGRSVGGSRNCDGSRIWNFDGGCHWTSSIPCETVQCIDTKLHDKA